MKQVGEQAAARNKLANRKKPVHQFELGGRHRAVRRSGAFAVAAKAGLERRSLHLANMGLVMMHRCVFEGAVIAPVSDVAERNGGKSLPLV